MGRLSRLAWARIGYAAGVALTAVGTGLEFGVPWGLIVAGAAGSVSCLLLIDVDKGGES